MDRARGTEEAKLRKHDRTWFGSRSNRKKKLPFCVSPKENDIHQLQVWKPKPISSNVNAAVAGFQKHGRYQSRILTDLNFFTKTKELRKIMGAHHSKREEEKGKKKQEEEGMKCWPTAERAKARLI